MNIINYILTIIISIPFLIFFTKDIFFQIILQWMANGYKSFSIKKDTLARTRVYLVFALVLVGLYYFIRSYRNSDSIGNSWFLAYLITGAAMTFIPLSTYSKKFKSIYGGIESNEREHTIELKETIQNSLAKDEAINTIADERKEGTIMDFEIKREIKLHKESVIQKAIESGIIHKDSYDNLRVYFETGNAPNKIKFLEVKFDDLKPLSKNSSFLTFFCVLFENDIIQQYEDIRLDDNKNHSTVELRREILDEMNMNFDIGENIEDLLGKHFISRKKETVEKQKSMIKKMIGLKS